MTHPNPPEHSGSPPPDPEATGPFQKLAPTALQRCGAVASVAEIGGPPSLFAAPALLQPVLDSLPPPLPEQVLVDLLKNPLCVGKARRVVLEQLSRHYGRPFADQWDFARFAEEQILGLDLLSPPRPAVPTP